jgi:hypothetical protein
MKVEIINILDRSGSMSGLRGDVIGGYNGFMTEQKTLPGQARATLVQFNSQIETLYEGVNIQHLGVLTQAAYVTEGSTSLSDAIGTTLARQGARIEREGWADKVIVNIFTDGEENTSREFTVAAAKALIKQYQDEKGWGILFQGAGIDAFKAADGFGISGATTRNVAASGAGVAEAYGTMSAYATSIRTSA